MSSKSTILFLSRPRLDLFYINIIRELKDDANVVVLLHEDSSHEFYEIDGIQVEKDTTVEERKEFIRSMDSSSAHKITQLENELGINCYASNINYAIYEIFVSRYSNSTGHRFRNENIEPLFLLRSTFLKKIVAKYNVDYCFFEVVDLIACFVLEAMSRKGLIKQVFVQSLISVGSELRLRLTSGVNARSQLLEHVYESAAISENSYKWAAESIDAAKQKDTASSYDQLKRSQCRVVPRYSFNQVVQKAQGLLSGESLLPAIIKIKNRVLAKRYFSQDIGNKKNISVFLQVVPEAGLMSELPEFAHQEILIEQLSVYGKAGYNILVKEHPSGFGNNLPRFYKELSLLSNVVLLPPSYPTREVLLRSEAVVVATGTTVGLEALMLGVPIITIGKPYYDVCKNVINVDKPKDLWDVLPDVKFDEEDQLRFFAALYEASYSYPPYVSDAHFEEGKDSAPIVAAALKKEITLYEKGILPCPAGS
ncbi:MAG: hypothetical protein BA863_18545 [Desulfovibrio sp. S3730MH75]|nr:MAG: hypothetical protein BA863_18545 [Desulfovibrio sp. S3730MH75]